MYKLEKLAANRWASLQHSWMQYSMQIFMNQCKDVELYPLADIQRHSNRGQATKRSSSLRYTDILSSTNL